MFRRRICSVQHTTARIFTSVPGFPLCLHGFKLPWKEAWVRCIDRMLNPPTPNHGLCSSQDSQQCTESDGTRHRSALIGDSHRGRGPGVPLGDRGFESTREGGATEVCSIKIAKFHGSWQTWERCGRRSEATLAGIHATSRHSAACTQPMGVQSHPMVALVHSMANRGVAGAASWQHNTGSGTHDVLRGWCTG